MPDKTQAEKIDDIHNDLQALKGNPEMGIKGPFERLFDGMAAIQEDIKDLPCKNPEALCPKEGQSGMSRKQTGAIAGIASAVITGIYALVESVIRRGG